MDNADRIDVETAREHLTSGDALLVCAYDDRERCRQNQLEGAIDLQGLQAIEARLPEQQEIIFYCA